MLSGHANSIETLRIAFDVTSVNQHREWFRYLLSKQFHTNFGNHFHSRDLLNELTQAAQDNVQAKVYDAHEPLTPPEHYQRSENLLHSMVARADRQGSDMAGVAVLSDIDIPGPVTTWSTKGSAEAKELDGYSYGAFFLKPDEWHSFIKPTGKPYRNFFPALRKVVRELTLSQASRAAIAAMQVNSPG